MIIDSRSKAMPERREATGRGGRGGGGSERNDESEWR